MRILLGLLFGGILMAVPAIAYNASKSLDDIEMKWKPTTDLTDFNGLGLGAITAKISIQKFTDARKIEPKNKIGENREDDSKVLPVTTKSDVAAFVTDNLRSILSKVGLDIADAGAPYTLSGDIVDYFITETNTYKGNLTVRLVLKKGDKVVWRGAVIGSGSRFGRSFKYDNYMEVFSDTLIDFALQLAKSTDFRKALEASSN